MSVSTDMEEAVMTMDAEHMREICRRGKGSRGGKGARKRRNGGKVSTRRLSSAEEEAETIRLRSLERHLAGKVEPEQARAADAVLKKHLANPVRTDNPVHMWKDISRLGLQKFVLNGDKQYRVALDLVITLRVRVLASGQIERHCRLMQEALSERHDVLPAGSRKAKIGTEDDLVRAISRLTIDFGVPLQSDTKKVSRFVGAVRFLIAKGVGPGGVEPYYEEHGGGIDEWHRSDDDVKATKKLKLAAAARQVEAQRREMDDWDDDTPSGGTNWAEKEPVTTREEHRLVKLSGVSRWKSSLLQYFKWDKKIEDGQVMVAIVVGDVNSPSDVRLVETLSLGEVIGSPTSRFLRLKRLVQSVQQLQLDKAP